MPGILDRGTQLVNELELTVFYGDEINNLDAATRKQAGVDLLPELEKLVDLSALQAFNEKCRKWIDQHPRP